MVLMAVFMALWATLAIAPETAIGRALHRLMVARPASTLTRLNRGHIVVVLVLLTVSLLLLWAAGGDGLKVIAMGTPETVTWLTTFEISAYVDALIAISAAATSVRLQGSPRRLIEAISTRLGFRKVRVRAIRNRRGQRSSPANDDDQPVPLRLAS